MHEEIHTIRVYHVRPGAVGTECGHYHDGGGRRNGELYRRRRSSHKRGAQSGVYGDNVIRKVNAAGIITTKSGTGVQLS